MTIFYFLSPQLSSVRMQGLLLLIFVKHVHLPFIRDIHTHYTRTGLYGYWVRAVTCSLMVLCASPWAHAGTRDMGVN